MATSLLLIVLYYMKCVFSVDASVAADNPLEVTSPAGTFKGTAVLSLQGHIYKAFLGIPFAVPPVGTLRFSKPKPYPKIEHVFDATQPAPICIQPVGVSLGSPAQEDCLYLNVYIPDNNKQHHPDDDVLKKVFVYIHGGSFFMGSSREYLPGDLVTLGDVIVITFNYRLSWMGFLKGNTSELPGNQGMWDQLLALKWVKDNIRSFGGDPDDITIGGNSMGGESVSALSIVSHAKGLFTKGLIMSGTMFTCPSTPGSSDQLLELLTDRIGCKHESIDSTVRCLKELPAEKFILPLEGHLTNKFTTIDGDLFLAPIVDLIKDKDYLTDIGFYNRNYIVSVTNNEGAIEFFGPFNLGVDPDTMSADFLSQRYHIPVSVCKKILAWYQEPNHFTFKPSYDILDDYIIAFPAYRFLETSALGSDGMAHGFDLMYLFDFEPSQMLQYYYHLNTTERFTEVDFQMKKVYIDMVTDFMKSGIPDVTLRKNFNVQWPAFDLKSQDCLSFGPTPFITPSPLKDRMYFWDKLFPQYMKDYLKSHHRLEL